MRQNRSMSLAIYLLTCANNEEAEAIADALLDKRLIACAKTIPINSKFRWKDNIDSAMEILMLLESREDKFQEIENCVRKLHSHETFVLVALPLLLASKGVNEWIDKNLE